GAAGAGTTPDAAALSLPPQGGGGTRVAAGWVVMQSSGAFPSQGTVNVTGGRSASGAGAPVAKRAPIAQTSPRPSQRSPPMPTVTAGCLCGAVRLTATGAPWRVGLCHCLDCRKHHGALFHASAILPYTAVSLTGETLHIRGRLV